MKNLLRDGIRQSVLFTGYVFFLLTLYPCTAYSDLCPPVNRCWTTQDIIDTHIDPHAQTALRGMLTRGGTEADVASSLLCSVKRREIEGIYLPDQRIPALRSRGAGSNWWDMIKSGNSECYTSEPPDYKKPPGKNVWPVIVFRKQIKDNSSQVAAALSDAWHQCLDKAKPRIQPLGTRCATIAGKQPKPPPKTPGTTNDGILTVTVLCKASPVVNATVTIPVGSGSSQVEKRSTDGGGQAQFTLPSGEWSVVASAESLPCQTPTNLPPGYEYTKGGTAYVIAGRNNFKTINFVTTAKKGRCSDAEMAAQFHRQQEFCAAIRSQIDLACQLGASPCDIAGPASKAACAVYESIYGKPPPELKPPACYEPAPTFYEKCVVTTILGEKKNMPCDPGSRDEILQRYRSWPGRVK